MYGFGGPESSRLGRTIGGVDATLAAVLAVVAAVAGLVVGAVLARVSRRPAPSGRAAPSGGAARPDPTRGMLSPGAGSLLAVLPGSTVVLDRADAVVQASPSAYSLGVVRGDRLQSAAVLSMVRMARQDGQIHEATFDVRRGPAGAGAATTLATRVAPVGPDLVVVLVEDRTEARRVEDIRRDFVANVSHELKTPVGGLGLLAEAVTDAAEDPDAVRRFASRMQHEASRLSAMVQDLLDLSRLQSEDPLRPAGQVSVDDVVAEALDLCRTAATSKQIVLDSRGEQGIAVVGDEGQLITAVRNLVHNAVAYSAAHTRVAVSVRRVDDIVEISVTDQGIGIPAGDLQRIFERFYRVDPARSRETGGTGLGLSIVKHVVANHGGEVTVWSREGTGSTFTIRLPLVTGPGLGRARASDGVPGGIDRLKETAP